MKRPTPPTARVAPVLPPTCFQHTPAGSVKYCPACAAARIDHDRALNPVPTYKQPHPMLLAAASVLAGAAVVVLVASLFLMTGVLTWR